MYYEFINITHKVNINTIAKYDHLGRVLQLHCEI